MMLVRSSLPTQLTENLTGNAGEGDDVTKPLAKKVGDEIGQESQHGMGDASRFCPALPCKCL